MTNATYPPDLNASTNTSRITRADALELLAAASQMNAQLSAQLRHEQHLSAFLRTSLHLAQRELQSAANVLAEQYRAREQSRRELDRCKEEVAKAAKGWNRVMHSLSVLVGQAGTGTEGAGVGGADDVKVGGDGARRVRFEGID